MDLKLPGSKQLVYLISILLLAGFATTTFASYYVSKEVMRTAIQSRELPLTSDNIYSEVQRDLFRPILISSVMATDTFVRDWALSGERNPDKIVNYLGKIQEKYDTISAFFVSDKTGTYYHPAGILKTVSESDQRDIWYFRVKNMSAQYEINIDHDQANRDKMTIFINYRVLDYDGNFIGATGVGLAVDSVTRLIETYHQKYQRNVFFVTPDGKVVLKGGEMPDSITSITEEEGYSKIAEEILSSDHSSLNYTKNGATLLVDARLIPELKWYLVVEQAEDPLLVALKKTLYGNLAVCVVVSLIILGATNLTISRYRRKIERLATTDNLTGLLNRHSFEVAYHLASEQSKRNQTPLSAILLDIDNFKKINDTYGHLVGDKALVTATQSITDSLRAADISVRWGGEEFLVILSNCDCTSALALAEKIRTTLANSIVEHEGQRISLSASFGIAQKIPAESLDRFLSRLDGAMYTAKQSGRNRCILDPAEE